MACLPCKLFEIEELCPPIALPEGMNVIHIAQNFPCLAGERRGIESFQEIARGKAAVNIGHAVLNEAAELKLAPAFGNLDGANLARPIIDVLKQMAMEGFQVAEVEIAGRDALGDALHHELALEELKLFRIPQAKLVLEYRIVRRITVFGIAHSAA